MQATFACTQAQGHLPADSGSRAKLYFPPLSADPSRGELQRSPQSGARPPSRDTFEEPTGLRPFTLRLKDISAPAPTC